MTGILVESPGLLTTVQDLGRPGLGRFGVSPSGAMDPFALRVANLLVGNGEGAPALEITAVGPRLHMLLPVRFALTGAHLSPSLDGEPIETWRVHLAAPGQVLAFGPRRRGARCYMAVAGGLAVPPVLGSAATDLDAGLGGLDGGPVRSGLLLSVGQPGPAVSRHAGPGVLRQYAGPFELRVVLEPEVLRHREAVAGFLATRYRVGPNWSRMGYRLEGPPIVLPGAGEMDSEPVPPGTVQAPPDGGPILLMADRQTVGGYPRLGQVISADVPRAAQLWVGHEVRFVAVDIATARAVLVEQETAVAVVKAS